MAKKAKEGLCFVMNYYPNSSEYFVVKHRYRYTPDFVTKKFTKTLIDLEVYHHQICVLSFYDPNVGTDKNRYSKRLELGTGHIKAIFTACLKAYEWRCKGFALVFVANNDEDSETEENARLSAYKLFLENYFNEFEDNFVIKGSIKLNTVLVYPSEYKYVTDAEKFFVEFEENVNNSNQEEANGKN